MNKPTLTIGLPTHSDALGIYQTIMSIRLMHSEYMKYVEFLVIDQNPNSTHGVATKDFLTWVTGDVHSARYIPFTENYGSAVSKERVFQEARGEIVLCIDSHIFLWKNSVRKLLEYFGRITNSKDMLVGPMVYDNLVGCSTHLDNVWRGEQWGTWAEAKRCNKCNNAIEISVNPNGILSYKNPAYHLDNNYYIACRCGNRVTPRQGASLDQSLLESGFTSMIFDDDESVFEVWAHGTGLMACRKEAWVGFPKGMRGFGAEEVIIHEKFRRAGGKILCAPWLKWVHRFLRPDGVKYPLTRHDKVRNFVLGFRELGLDLEPIYNHFVKSNLISQKDWESILENKQEVTNPNTSNTNSGCGSCNKVNNIPLSPHMQTLETWYEYARVTPHDINEHVRTLRELASKCNKVIEFGSRHSISTVALLAGVKEKFISYFPVKYGEADYLTTLGNGKFEFRVGDSLTTEIEECDLLFIDTVHTASYLYQELSKHHNKVNKYIVLHDTVTFGEQGEGGQPGLLPALRKFMQEHPEWSVIKHWRNNNGLMLISKDPNDRKPLPSNISMAWNFAKALTKRAVTRGGTIEEEKLKKRLEICTLCESRNEDRCSECGCPCFEKATWASESCPLGFWAQEGV